jgi:uncharacterized protein GlcG (DUF336 family)
LATGGLPLVALRRRGHACAEGVWAKRTETANAGQRMLADVIPLGGGMPIKIGEETIGGVGLSGAVSGQPKEEACAKAGLAKVADQLK